MVQSNTSSTTLRTFPTRNPLPEETRIAVAAALNAHLAGAIALYTHIKHAHWNVQGEGFLPLHELFDTIAGDAQEWADLIAERTRQLGATALGTVQHAAARSSLPAYPEGLLAPEQHTAAVADRLAQFSAGMEAVIEQAAGLNDAVTADICTEIARAADKHVWFLESSLPAGMTATPAAPAGSGGSNGRTSGGGGAGGEKPADAVDESVMESFPASDPPATRGHQPPKGQPSRSTAGAPSRLGNKPKP